MSSLPWERLKCQSVEELSYTELSNFAGEWIRDIEFRTAHLSPGGFDLAKRALSAHAFGLFRSQCRPRSSLGRAQVELFLTTRLRRFVLPYLSLQEGKEYDRTDAANTREAARIFRYYLNSTGKRPALSLHFKVAGLSASISLDPMPLLRPVYTAILNAHRHRRALTFWESASVRFNICRFTLRTSLAQQSVKLIWFLVNRRPWTSESFRRVFRWQVTRRHVCLAILTLFPKARTLNDDAWARLLSRLESYFPERIERFFQVVPRTSLRNHGIAKLLKIAFGVVLGRAASTPPEGDPGDWIFESLIIAWCWGITYPLVDDVLDQDQIGLTQLELITALRILFTADESIHEPSAAVRDPAAKEAVERLGELFKLFPADRLSTIKHWLRLLLEAHHRDSSRQLPSGDESVSEGVIECVWRDSLLKASLIRLSTLAICGFPVDAADLAHQFRAALLNQWGDDLWDVYEDSANRRMTPFTLFLYRYTSRNPFVFFFRYSQITGTGLSRRRQLALLFGAMETSRCLFDEITSKGRDPLEAVKAVRNAMAVVGVDPSLVGATPHVDADAILFAFEDSLLEGSAL